MQLLWLKGAPVWGRRWGPCTLHYMHHLRKKRNSHRAGPQYTATLLQ